MPRGTTATTHIFKPSIGKLPNGLDLKNSGENEYFCMKSIAAPGIEGGETANDDFRKKKVLVVERFDRRDRQ
jgi:serine/threonine-protein kinase HipA